MKDIIQSIVLKDWPIVKFQTLVSEGQNKDCVYPGKKSDPVLPLASFENALNQLQAVLESEFQLSTDFIWRLDSVIYLWNEEQTEFGFRAKLVGNQHQVGKLTAVVEQSSPDYVSDTVADCLDALQEEAKKFIRGKGAQFSLLDQFEDMEAA